MMRRTPLKRKTPLQPHAWHFRDGEHLPIRTKLRRRSKTPRAVLRQTLDTLVGRLACIRDKRANGGKCAICKERGIDVGYHLVPKQRGDAVRWEPLNVVGACSPCNKGEVMNRDLYRDKHVALYGDTFLTLERKSRELVKFSMADLRAIKTDLEARLERVLLDTPKMEAA